MPPSKWKGQSKSTPRPGSKPAKPSKASTKAASSSQTAVPTADLKPTPSPQELASQQKLLTIFQSAFNEVLSSPDFPQTLQEIKSALYDRDFERAFGREDYLDVYAARWSPTRALGYAAVFESLRDWLEDLMCDEGRNEVSDVADSAGASEGVSDAVERIEGLTLHGAEDREDGQEEVEKGEDSSEEAAAAVVDNDLPAAQSKKLKLLALGGAAAELTAFASFLSTSPNTTGDVTLLDTGPWDSVVSKLYTATTTTLPISKYASAAAKASNGPLVSPTQLQHRFLQEDVLAMSQEELKGILGPMPLLVTLLFTLNELYTGGGIGKTTSFLRTLSRMIPESSLLLVVDSPGSYSEAAVGKGGEESVKKKYPMSWLVDHTLLHIGEETRSRRQVQNEETAGEAGSDSNGKAAVVEGCRWEKLEEKDSIWFRMPEDVRYPIGLENMRYQIHLYRAISVAGGQGGNNVK